MKITLKKTLIIVNLVLLAFFADESFSSEKKRFKDFMEREITVNYPVSSIVSLAPSITEIIYEIGAENSLVGVTSECNYPPKARQKDVVGSYGMPDIEKIVKLKPDIVITYPDGLTPEFLKRLERFGIPSFVLTCKNISEIYAGIETVAMLTGSGNRGTEITSKLKKKTERIRTAVNGADKKKVLFLRWLSPVIAVGKNSFEDKLIAVAGGVNITGGEQSSYPRINIESIIKSQPDVIIMTNKSGGSPYDDLKRIPGFSKLNAVRGGSILILDDDPISRPAIRIFNSLEQIAKYLHPERFK